MTPPPAKAGGGREGVPTARTDPKGTPPQPSPAFAGEGAKGEIDEIPAPDLVRTVPAQDPDHPDPAVDPGRVPAVRPAQRRAHPLDQKSVVSGKRWAVRGDLGGSRL